MGMKKFGPIQMELVTEQKGIIPGEEFWIGWRIVRQEGWHTYWKHPGDVGVAPSIEWELPHGFLIGELLYCLPEKVKMGSIRANGHCGETLFLAKAQAPQNLKVGNFISIEAKASWLACSRKCLPGFGNLNLELEIVQEKVFDASLNKRFEEFRKLIPKSLGDHWKASALERGRYIELSLENEVHGVKKGQNRTVFFCTNRLIRSDGIQFYSLEQDTIKLRLERSDWADKDEKFLSGLVYREGGWGGEVEGEYFSIRVPLVPTE